MNKQSWAERIAVATSQTTMRQVGAVPVLYPRLEALEVRGTINAGF